MAAQRNEGESRAASFRPTGMAGVVELRGAVLLGVSEVWAGFEFELDVEFEFEFEFEAGAGDLALAGGADVPPASAIL